MGNRPDHAQARWIGPVCLFYPGQHPRKRPMYPPPEVPTYPKPQGGCRPTARLSTFVLLFLLFPALRRRWELQGCQALVFPAYLRVRPRETASSSSPSFQQHHGEYPLQIRPETSRSSKVVLQRARTTGIQLVQQVTYRLRLAVPTRACTNSTTIEQQHPSRD